MGRYASKGSTKLVSSFAGYCRRKISTNPFHENAADCSPTVDVWLAAQITATSLFRFPPISTRRQTDFAAAGPDVVA